MFLGEIFLISERLPNDLTVLFDVLRRPSFIGTQNLDR